MFSFCWSYILYCCKIRSLTFVFKSERITFWLVCKQRVLTTLKFIATFLHFRLFRNYWVKINLVLEFTWQLFVYIYLSANQFANISNRWSQQPLFSFELFSCGICHFSTFILWKPNRHLSFHHWSKLVCVCLTFLFNVCILLTRFFSFWERENWRSNIRI